MKTSKQLEVIYGITPERIAEIDEDASKGVLQGVPAEIGDDKDKTRTERGASMRASSSACSKYSA